MKPSELNKIIGDALETIPATVKDPIKKRWESKPAIHPETHEQMDAPVFVLMENWSQIAAREEGSFLENYHDDRCIIFDTEFVLEAPPEVVQNHLALIFAQIFLNSARGIGARGAGLITQSAIELVKNWRVPTDDISTWVVALKRFPANPTEMFYGLRFYQHKLLPPASADINSIRNKIRENGFPTLAERVRIAFYQAYGLGTKIPESGDPIWN